MKRSFFLVIAATLWLTTGCSSSPSSDRYIEAAAPTVEPTSSAAEQPDPTESPQEQPQTEPVQTESAQPEPSQTASAQPDGEQASEKPAEPAKKQTKSQQIKEAKKNNESVTKAVTDSIMNKESNKAAASGPDAERLKKSIEQIRSLVKDLKQQTEGGDSAKIKETASLIAQEWAAMKADVDASYSDMTRFLQEKIDKLNDLQAAETIDSEAMLQLDYELYQAFRQLADKAGL